MIFNAVIYVLVNRFSEVLYVNQMDGEEKTQDFTGFYSNIGSSVRKALPEWLNQNSTTLSQISKTAGR